MSTQTSFVSYRESKTPEERRAYVDQQIALGNPKYKSRAKWIQENQATIRVGALEKEVANNKEDIAMLKALLKTNKLMK
tara:strand:+ start:89 stop:325 length:237 start_codon:yes stop_codon:yes gene_type:complete